LLILSFFYILLFVLVQLFFAIGAKIPRDNTFIDGSQLLVAVTDLMNLLLEGKTPSPVPHSLFGANLYAKPKMASDHNSAGSWALELPDGWRRQSRQLVATWRTRAGGKLFDKVDSETHSSAQRRDPGDRRQTFARATAVCYIGVERCNRPAVWRPPAPIGVIPARRSAGSSLLLPGYHRAAADSEVANSPGAP